MVGLGAHLPLYRCYEICLTLAIEAVFFLDLRLAETEFRGVGVLEFGVGFKPPDGGVLQEK